MSVTLGFVPSGKPHPAMKWSLLVALFVMVLVGLPNRAAAGQPSVQAPTGTQVNGVFTSSYSFATYINCDAGPSFNSSYSNALLGTHTFNFESAADGSLLVAIDGGGAQLITSCGTPVASSSVAVYTVTYDPSYVPPTPTPTPTPTPAPTATPAGGGGATHSGGGSAGSAAIATPTPHAGSTPVPSGGTAVTPVVTPPSTITPVPSLAPSTAPTVAPVARALMPKLAVGSATQAPRWHWQWTMALLVLAGLAGLVWLAWRSVPVRAWLDEQRLRWQFRLEPSWLRWRLAWRGFLRGRGRDVPKARGLSPHHHSGRLLAHHHTSYPALAFLVLLSGVVLTAYSVSSRADSTLSVTVPGPAPTTAATIDDPPTGEHLATAVVTVRGTCPQDLLVEVYRNGTFAASAACDTAGLYNVLVTLVPGQNDLIAKDADGLQQYGPDSATVTVYYDPPPIPSPSPTPSSMPTASPVTSPAATPASSGRPAPPTVTPRGLTISPSPAAPATAFILSTDQHSATGLQAGQSFTWTVALSGGVAPYHLQWDWGDGQKSTFTVPAAETWAPSHTYAQAGRYQVVLEAQDAAGQEAAMSLVAIVNGGTVVAPTTQDTGRGTLLIAWPLMALTALVVVSFWLGERHRLALWRWRVTPSM